MIGLLHVLSDVTKRLEKLNIDYFLVGSIASIYYSRPRFTQDIDLVLTIKATQVTGFEQAFPLSEYYCPPPEVLRDEVGRKGSFKLIHQQSGVKVDIVLNKETELYKSEFQRRQLVEIAPDIRIYIASPEDVILHKLIFFREGESEKHLLDIKEIAMNNTLDQQYLSLWVNKLGLAEIWSQI